MTLVVSVCVSTTDRPDSHLIYTYPNFYKLSPGLVHSVCVCVSETRHKPCRVDI